MRALTPTQREILQLIRAWTRTTGSAPTRSEIAWPLGLRSANAAEAHAQALAQKDVPEWLPAAARGMGMKGAGIRDGDLPAVHRSADAAKGRGVDMRKRAVVIDGKGEAL